MVAARIPPDGTVPNVGAGSHPCPWVVEKAW